VRDAMLKVSQRGLVGLNVLVATAPSRKPAHYSVYKRRKIVSCTTFGALGLGNLRISSEIGVISKLWEFYSLLFLTEADYVHFPLAVAKEERPVSVPAPGYSSGSVCMASSTVY
jgi:hypothetical protein